jgi:N-acetylneuraminate lyase
MSTQLLHLTGLIAAPHTPMNEDFSLNLPVVPRQVEILISNGVKGAFICGSTGESHSLTVAERMQVAEAWKRAIGSKSLKLIVHAGHNCLEDARTLAAHAQSIRADAVAITSPSYFKPAAVEDLVDFCTPIAAAARELPFYFYDIPMLTGVNLPMAEFLRQAPAKIPNLAGLKFTNPNLVALQQCLACDRGRFNILFGVDELLLAALALGVSGAVGSTYNFAAPLYQKIIAAHQNGDLATAQASQLKSVKLVDTLLPYGVLTAGKALMSQLGAECGPMRPPLRRLTAQQKDQLYKQVAELGVLGKPVV